MSTDCWTPTSIIWYIDGVETHRAPDATCARYAQLCGPMYLCFNLALGGGWAGNPDSTTPFPSKMEIDYVRVKSV